LLVKLPFLRSNMNKTLTKYYKLNFFFTQERKFGFLIFLLFLFFFKLTKSPYILYFELFILFVTLFLPSSLKLALNFWLKIGFLIGKVTTPLFLGVIFFGLFAPISLYFKLTNRDFLRMSKKNRKLKSFWIPKYYYEKDMRSFFKNQF